MCQNTKCSGQGEQVWERRARESLERGGASPEGASNPQARRRFVSAVLYPSSEMEFRLRGRGLTIPVGR
jgi:hypothetical protein